MSVIKIATSQLNYHTGNFEWNTRKIIAEIEKAKINGADLIVFSELSISGYPPRDFLEFSDFIDECNRAVDLIASHCTTIAAIVGSPTYNNSQAGKPLFNSAYFIYNGAVQHITHKTLLPNYDIFDEYRYFEPNSQFETITYKGVKIALTICEDLWNIEDKVLYKQSPMDELIKQQPDLIINIAASPYSQTQIADRNQILSANVKRYNIPLLYVNMTGAQTQLIFDGGSMALDAKGNTVDRLNHFEEDSGFYQFSKSHTSATLGVLKPHNAKNLNKYEQIEQALVLGIREYFHKQGFQQAILGLSGGIDSAVVLALAVKALGNQHVRVLLLPSEFSSAHSIDDSVQMATTLNVQYDIVPINKAYDSFSQTLDTFFSGTPFGIAEENLQSRTRGVLLMAMSNKFGYILLNTSNKSELAVGYGTLYGDMCGGLSVIGDLYKTEVYELAHHLNSEKEIIPKNIITKAPSAELRPNQKDADTLPDYAVLDRILFAYIEDRKSPSAIIDQIGDANLVKRTLNMVNANEWKRLQAPPVLRVSGKAFGPGRRMPIVAKYLI